MYQGREKYGGPPKTQSRGPYGPGETPVKTGLGGTPKISGGGF